MKYPALVLNYQAGDEGQNQVCDYLWNFMHFDLLRNLKWNFVDSADLPLHVSHAQVVSESKEIRDDIKMDLPLWWAGGQSVRFLQGVRLFRQGCSGITVGQYVRLWMLQLWWAEKSSRSGFSKGDKKKSPGKSNTLCLYPIYTMVRRILFNYKVAQVDKVMANGDIDGFYQKCLSQLKGVNRKK